MHIKHSNHVRFGLALMFFVGAQCLVGAPGRCDATYTGEVRVSHGAVSPGSSQPDPAAETSQLKVLFKGKMARYEGPKGRIMLYDGAKGRVYTLNEFDKTYRSQSLKEAWKTNDALLPSLLPGVDFDVTLKLNKTDAVETKAGLSAQRYEVIGSAKTQTPQEPSSNRGFGGGGGGRRGRRGGFPGGGSYGGRRGGDSDGRDGQFRNRALPPRISVQVSGEVWLAGNAPLPDAHLWTVAALAARAIPQGPLLKAAVDRLTKMKQAPLSSNLTFRLQGPGSRRTR